MVSGAAMRQQIRVIISNAISGYLNQDEATEMIITLFEQPEKKEEVIIQLVGHARIPKKKER